MKKLAVLLLQWLAISACMGGAELSPKDASDVADSAYNKKDSFTETVLSARRAYKDWQGKCLKGDSSVKYGQWYISQCIEKNRKNALSAIDPTKKPVNVNEVFSRRPVWSKSDMPDCSVSDLHAYNWRLINNGVFYLVRDIDALQPCDVYATIGFEHFYKVFLNGKQLAGVDKMPKLNLEIYKLNLNKGRNTLVIVAYSNTRLNRDAFYFAPFADPAAYMGDKLATDFKYYFQVINNSRYSPNKDRLLPVDLIASDDNRNSLKEAIGQMIEASMFSANKFEKEYAKIAAGKSSAANEARIKLLGDMLSTLRAEKTLGYDVGNVRAAMEDIKKSYPEYDADGSLFSELKKWESEYGELKQKMLSQVEIGGDLAARAAEFKAFADRALLANPLLKKYPKWVYVKRLPGSSRLGFPQNWQGNSTLACKPWVSNDKRDKKTVESFKDELWTFDMSNPRESRLLFKPESGNIICDLDVSYDASKVLYSTFDDKMHFQLAELDIASGKVRQITPSINPDIDNYDGIYLPDGRIVYCSTACYVGVPCVGGIDYVANLYSLDPSAGDEKAVDDSIRQLTFEQDADWMPTMLENGRIMYTRWEYVDNSHYFSRILMHMNPDGTAQSSLYGSVSYWPNSLFYARQIPGDPNKFMGIVSGHHGISRMGELHMFDISKGTKEDSGRVHKFPSYGREYVAETKDELVRGKFPLVVHPYPLSENYVVASVKNPMANQGLPGIYLLDKFDNMTLLTAVSPHNKFAELEPMPLAERKKPAAISDRTDRDLDYGYVFLNDIYQGEGLKDVPRGTVKALRVLEYHYAYRDMGSHDIIANEGSWDVKRIHGTVPVEEDGSALFKVPANRPMAIQPLDKDGKAIALMRTWFTVMPGETQSCVGCHEGQGMSPTFKPAMASRKRPSEIKQFIAGVRGYSFTRDVQPVLDKYCAGCHDGKRADIPDFSRGPAVIKKFPRAYLELSKYVRRGGPECNQNMLIPMEFYSDTSELMQILRKGHKGVKLDKDSMDILVTWMDLNVPCVGTWTEIRNDIPHNGAELRKKYLAKYANRHDDQNAITYDGGVQKFVKPQSPKPRPKGEFKLDCFPFDAAKAGEMRDGENLPKEISADLGGGVKLRLSLVPSGTFVMGSDTGFGDEGPARVAKVEKPFYMGQFEITNKQYSLFDRLHNSGYLDRQWKDHVNRGYPANNPNQPVIRVNWNQAVAYCDWLSKKFGVKFSLPSEKQWEWAARAGTATPFWFGKPGDNYGHFENFSDFSVRDMAVNGVDPQPRVENSDLNNIQPYDAYACDGQLLSADVGSFKPNAFGLYDMLGNVSEWTSDSYSKTLGGEPVEGKKVARGSSWRDRAKRSVVTMRRDYYPWQKVYNVGFRVVVDDARRAAELFGKSEPLPPYRERNVKPLVDTIPSN